MLLIVSYSYSAEFPEIKQFKPESEVLSYEPDNLYEYINGGADAYLAYGFQHLITRDFSFQNLKFSVDIYDMGSRINAFGIYTTERPGNVSGLKIGVDAVVSPPYQCLMLKGNKYVKLNIFEGEFTIENGKIILQAVAAALKGSTDYPQELKLLPQKFRIKNSEGYNREAFLGLSILQQCLYAKYQIGDKTVQYYAIVPGKRASIKNYWEKLKAKWRAIELNSHTILFKKIPYKGFTGVVKINRKILGVADCETKEQMLELLKTQL